MERNPGGEVKERRSFHHGQVTNLFSLRDCVVIRDVEPRAKAFPFAKGGFFEDVKP